MLEAVSVGHKGERTQVLSPEGADGGPAAMCRAELLV